MPLYYHGGPAGRTVGDYILPPSVTKAPSCSSFGAAGIHRRDRVYITNDPHAALLFACGAVSGRGAVYVVEPEGELEPDPDWSGPAGGSLQCVRAKVVAVRPVKGKMVKRVRRQVLGAA
jgi:hypothetical protein